jgi:hypothetical protein
MENPRTDNVSRSWIGLAGILIVLEFIFLYEAMIADMGGNERFFAVLAGLAILCFAALLYAAAVVLYGWD